MGETIIRVERLGKRYRLGRRERYKSLRETLVALATFPGRLLRRRGERDDETVWALRDLSVEVARGEVVGIIGRNGAGKSTLLRILARITEPTEGRAEVTGRVGSLLEVGTGFHPELTGRENIYLNGAVLGMRRAEIERRFDEIVAFSEVERFLETPVKHYSTGMYMRLAFAVAAHLETEIVLVDEVLAVGDAAFQRKCMGKMGEIATQGRTVLFVSHNMSAVAKLCGRGLVLERGRAAFYGDCGEAIGRYMARSAATGSDFSDERRTVEAFAVRIVDAWIERDGARTDSLMFGDRPVVMIRVAVDRPVRFSVELLLRDAQELPVAFCPSGLALDLDFEATPGDTWIRCQLPALRLAQGQYSLDLMTAKAGIRFFDCVESALTFGIVDNAIGGRNWNFRQNRGQGCMLWDVGFSRVDGPLPPRRA